MPGRGSGIGLSMVGGLGTNNAGGSATSARSEAGVYGSRFTGAVPGVGVHHYLWILVLIEIAGLVYLRHAFRRYHGG